MAFERKNFVRIGSSQTNGVPTQWQYKSTTDTVAQISDSAYFLEVATDLQIGDGIFITGTGPVSDLLAVVFIDLSNVVVNSITTGTAGQASHIIIAGGEFNTPGGDLVETIVVLNTLPTDIAFVAIKDTFVTGLTISRAEQKTNSIDVFFDADPLTSTVLYFQVLRSVV